jgi:hypothetical protein
MNIPVYIDCCAWNYLHENGVSLRDEIPQDCYSIFITREVEIEIDNIPNIENKKSLKEYMASNIKQHPVVTTSNFGFRTLESDGTPSEVQTFSGFGQGTFQSEEDRNFYASPEIKDQLSGKKKKKTGLSENQADASLAVRAQRAIILTNEKPGKAGPLKTASKHGGYVVSLKYQVEPSGLSIGKYLEKISVNFPRGA